MQDFKQLIFTAFDPLKGRGRELTRFDIDPTGQYTRDISPDGIHIAVLRNSEGRIRILSMNGQSPREITIKGWNSLDTVTWTATGNGLFVSGRSGLGSVLMQVDLQGNAHVLWKQPGGLGTDGLPSPDGRHLAMMGWTENSNMWMMENF